MNDLDDLKRKFDQFDLHIGRCETIAHKVIFAGCKLGEFNMVLKRLGRPSTRWWKLREWLAHRLIIWALRIGKYELSVETEITYTSKAEVDSES